MKPHGRIAPVACLAAIAAAVAPASSAAADLTVFIAESSPTEPWKTGFGAAIGASLLGLVTIEGEAARLPGQASDASMTSFGLGGFLSPPIGGVIPYGGLVVGLYRNLGDAFPRLTAVDAAGHPLFDNAVVVPGPVHIIGPVE